MKILKKYLFPIATVVALIILLLVSKEKGIVAYKSILMSFKEMLIVIPPIFILLGLMDEWVSKDKMMKYLGEGSGIKGNILSIMLGSFAAGPLYAAFPVAAMLMNKGTKYFNVMLFIGAWSTTKVPMVMFEITYLGWKFALTRLAVSLVGIFIIAFIVNAFMKKDELELIYEKSCNLDTIKKP